jgi:serine/threonine protein kinase/WD40 repeat protein
MNESRSTSDTREQVFDQFLQELEEADDKEAVVGKFTAAYPQWASIFVQEAVLGAAFAQAVPPAVEPWPEGLPDFRIEREIARGGMGVVYEAEQISLKRRVALKVRRGRLSLTARKRFEREQRVLAKLHQTHIVPIHTAGQAGTFHYFAMAYIEGAALHHVVQTTLHRETVSRQGTTPTLAELAGEVLAHSREAGRSAAVPAMPSLSASVALASHLSTSFPSGEPEPGQSRRLALSMDYFRSVARVMAEAAEALDYAHGLAILHRDVKPSNIMVDRKGECWLIDFGLAYLGDKDASAAQRPPPTDEGTEGALTQGPMGTPEYMAPEQHRGESADERSDVWGLGVTLYELLTLRRAFDSATRREVSTKIQQEEPAQIEELVGNVPADLAAICRMAMQKEPGRRYPSSEAFAEDLRRWLRSEPTMARPLWLLRRLLLWGRRNPGWAASFSIAVLLLTCVFGWIVSAAEAKAQLFKAEKDAAEAREQVAEQDAARAREQAEARKRELLQLQLQGLRLRTHRAGWSKEGMGLVRSIAKINADDALRNEAAACLVGIDAHRRALSGLAASSVAWAVDGKRVLFGGISDPLGRPLKEAVLWDVASDTLKASGRAGQGLVAFHADGTPLQLVASDPSTLDLWDVANQRLRRQFRLRADAETKKLTLLNHPVLALSRDGVWVAASRKSPGKSGSVVVWEAASGKRLKELPFKAEVLAFAPGGPFLAAGDLGGVVTVWSLPELTEIARLPASNIEISSLALNPDYIRTASGSRHGSTAPPWLLAVGDIGGTVRIWDLRARIARTVFPGSNFAVTAVAFSPDGATLASAGRPPTRLWDTATGRLLLELDTYPDVSDLAFSPDASRLAVCLQDSANPGKKDMQVDLWSLDQGRGHQTLRGLEGQAGRPAFSADGKLVAALAMSRQVAVWELASGRLLHVFEAPRAWWLDNTALTFGAKGNRLAVATEWGARLWDTASGKEVQTWELPPGLCNQLAFGPEGKLLLIRVETPDENVGPWTQADISVYPRICRVRDLMAPRPREARPEIRFFNVHVHDIALAPDGRSFAVDGLSGAPGSARRAVKVYDPLSGDVLWSTGALAKGSAGLQMDPLGRLLLYGLDGTANQALVELSSGKLVRMSRYSVVGPGGDYQCDVGDGLTLLRGPSATPLVTLGLDSHPTATWGATFDAAGTKVAWGTKDGTVIVANLAEVRDRLAEERLGWPPAGP